MKKLLILPFLILAFSMTFFACDDDDEDSATYYVKFKVDGVQKEFTKGFTGVLGENALSSHDSSSVTSVYAFPEAIAFSSVDPDDTYTDGILITDFDGKTAGTDSTCSVNYRESGTDYGSTTVSVTISSYGADGEAVVGTAADYTGNGKTISDIEFSVYNSGEE